MRPSVGKFTNPTGLIDKRVGDKYQLLEEIHEKLPQVAHLSYYLESLFNLDRNLALLNDENVDHHILKDITIFQGASAYDIAVANGFEGTQSEWISSLRGIPGVSVPQVLPDYLTEAEVVDIRELAARNALDIASAVQDIQGMLSADDLSTFSANLLSNEIASAISTANAVLANNFSSLETTVDNLSEAIDALPTSEDLNNIAQTTVNAELLTVNAAIDVASSRISAAETLISTIDGGLHENSIALANYVIANNDTVTTIQALQARTTDAESSILALDTATALAASKQLTLVSRLDENETNILDLQTTSAGQATSLNVLQALSGSNEGAITNLQTVSTDTITALTALTLRTDNTETFSTDTRTITTNNATAIAALGVRTDTSESTIINLQTVQSGQATAISTLSTATGNNTSSIGTLNTTVADNATRIVSVESHTDDLLRRALPAGLSTNLTGNIKFYRNAVNLLETDSNLGEIAWSGGHIDHPLLGRVVIPQSFVFTPYDGLTPPPNNVFYLMFTAQKAKARFSTLAAGLTDSNLVPVLYENGLWKVVDNSASTITFTPLDTDALVLIAQKNNSSAGIQSINSLLNYTGEISSQITVLETASADYASRIVSVETTSGANQTNITNLQTTTGNNATSISTLSANLTAISDDADAANVNASNASIEAATATATAAEAEALATTAAKIARSAINPNSTFRDFPGSDLPEDWLVWVPATRSKGPGKISNNALDIVAPAGANAGILYRTTVSNRITKGWWVMEATVEYLSGVNPARGTGMLLQNKNIAGTILHTERLSFHNSQEANRYVGEGEIGPVYNFSKMYEITDDTTTDMNLYLMAHYAPLSGGINLESVSRWHSCSVRPATSMEVAAGRVASLEASVTALSTAVVDINGNMAARYQLQVRAGSQGAELELVASDGETVGSAAKLVGNEIILDGTLEAAHFADGSLFNLKALTQTGSLDVVTTPHKGNIVVSDYMSGTFTSVGRQVRGDVNMTVQMFYPTSIKSSTPSTYNISEINEMDLYVEVLRNGSVIGGYDVTGLTWDPAHRGALVFIPGTVPAAYAAANDLPTRNVSFVFNDTPGAGNHTYSVRASYQRIRGAGAVQAKLYVSGTSVFITEIDN